MANLTTLSHEETEKVGSKASEANRDTLSNWIEDAGPKLRTAYQDAEKGMSSALKSVKVSVNRYPMSAIAIGFGIGCLTGFLAKSTAKRTLH